MTLKSRRVSANLTQKDVAEALKIGRNAVSMWETGESFPKANMLPALAELYGCTIDDLFKDE